MHMKKFYITLLLLFSFLYHFGQIIVTPNQTAAQLVDRLVGSGVTYFNPTLTCPLNASGKFDNAISTTVGMDSGVVLTTGSAL
jgi:hypothetical protein